MNLAILGIEEIGLSSISAQLVLQSAVEVAGPSSYLVRHTDSDLKERLITGTDSSNLLINWMESGTIKLMESIPKVIVGYASEAVFAAAEASGYTVALVLPREISSKLMVQRLEDLGWSSQYAERQVKDLISLQDKVGRPVQDINAIKDLMEAVEPLTGDFVRIATIEAEILEALLKELSGETEEEIEDELESDSLFSTKPDEIIEEEEDVVEEGEEHVS